MPTPQFHAPPPNLAALGREIARLRLARGWSLDELGRRTGASRKSIVNAENAHNVPRLETLHALAHGLGVPLSALVDHLCEGHDLPASREGQDMRGDA